MTNKDQQVIGAHVSISGGFYKAIEEGESIGCTAIQIFTKSNRQWASKAISQEDAYAFLDAQKKSSIRIVVAHASYLINLGSNNLEVQQKSLTALIEEIKRCHKLQIPYLVLHPGTAQKEKIKETISQTGKLINQTLEQTKDCSVSILLETMAGQGTSIASSFEELAMMIEQINDKNRIGVCFDTCHVFAAGYDLRTKENYTKTFQAFNRIIGLNYLKLFHINDSKKELGSRVDRHENIGQGAIGLNAFSLIMNDPQFKKIPKIIETPVGENELEDHLRNIQILLKLCL